MGDINKKYVIGVEANKKSLEQLKADLNNAIKEPFNKITKDGQVHGLSRSDKAAIKADLSELFGIADQQADALRKMVQGIIPSDTKGIENMKTQLQDTLKFATGIMEQMKLIGDSTDWMKQGVSFVDKFIGLQSTLENTRQIVDGIQTSVNALTESFKEFQNALATTNPDAFAKRFGKGAKSGVQADANIKAIAKEMTDAAERASRKIQDVIMDLEDDGIQIAVTLPDPNAAEFAAQINSFVQKASDQFKKNPIKLNVELLDPFKHETDKQLKGLQKEKAEQAKEVAKQSGMSSESLVGLDTPDTSRIIRNILDSFQKVQQAVREGQSNLTDATRKWRQEINNELTLKAKFDNLDIKTEVKQLMNELQVFLDDNPPLFIDVDVDNFVESLQEALKETVLTVNVKADNIDGKGATLNLGNKKLPSSDKIDVTPNNQETTSTQQSTTPVVNASKENTEAVSESTRMQVVLKDAIKQLQNSIDTNNERNEIAEKANAQRVEESNKNAKQIAEYSDKVTKAHEDIDSMSETRRRVKEKIPELEQKREDALKSHADRLRLFDDAVKNNDSEYIQKEFDWAVQYLNQEKQKTMDSIEEVKSRVDDGNKDKTMRYYKGVADDIDALLKSKEDQVDFILKTLKRAYQEKKSDIERDISGLTRAVDLQDKRIIGSNENIDYYNKEIERLSKEIEISRTKKGIQSRESQSKNQQQRLDNIQSILDSNQSPVQLVFNEVKEFWEKSYRTIEKTKQELDDLKNGKYSDDLKAKLEKLTKEEQKAMVQGLISSKEKRITDWETRQSLMSQKGLGNWTKGVKLEDVLKSFTVDSLTDILSKSSTLSDDLLSNSSLKSLSSIKELAYYAGVAQDALGFRTQTSQEYVDEATLQARLMELARIHTFTNKVQGMFPNDNGTPELQGIEAFIEFFEKLVVAKENISTIVSQAQGKIDTIQEKLIQKSIERRMLGEPENPIEYQNAQLDIARLQSIIDSPISIVDAAKEYLESFKNFANTITNDTKFTPGEDGKVLSASQMAQVIWDNMDTTVRDSVTKAMLSSSEFSGVKELNQVSIAGVLDKMTKVFETGALKDINSEDKSYKQLLALLDRQSKFQRVKTVSDLQYGGSIKGSLYDARTPDKPIYVKVVGSHGEESVYDVHKPQKGGADSDRSFSTTSKGLERFFKNLGITDQVNEIVTAMFNDPSLAQALTDQLFAGKNISLSTKPFTRTASKAYGFDDTPLAQYRKNKDKYDAQAKELESDIDRLQSQLQSGQYSESLLQQIEESRAHARQELQKLGKSESDIDAHLENSMGTDVIIKKIIEQKQKQLATIQQLKPTEEQITQSLIALMSDIEIGKAQLKDARRSTKTNTKKAARLTEHGMSGLANRQLEEQKVARNAADMIRSGTKGTSQNLANPLQQIIDRVQVASQYGLMDTKEIEQLLAQYDEAYKTARNMPRIKDAGTPVSMFGQINDAWAKEEELRNRVFEAFFGSDGWYVTQVVADQMSVIEGELARKEQSITSGASSANSAVESQIADINAKEAKAKQDADAYATKLYDKYLREPEAEIEAELRRRSAEIDAKAKQTQDAKDNLGSLADMDTGLRKLQSDVWNKMQQDPQYIELQQLRSKSTVGSPKHQRLVKEIKEIENKYTAEFNKARQAWIDARTAELDAEYEAFVQSVKEGAVGDASKNAVAKFNKDFKGKTTSKRKVSGIQRFIESERQRMYQEAEAATQQAMAALDMSGTVSPESVAKGIEKARKDAEKERKAVLKSVKKKSDAELMAEEHYGKAAVTTGAEVERLKKQNQKNESLLNDLLAQYNRTKEMLNAERGIYESSQATQTAIQQQLGDVDNPRTPGGQGIGQVINIDTSNLATEGTLRGIYELLNGGAPVGGWGDSNKKPDIADDDFSDGTASSMSALASSISHIVSDSKNYSVEVGYLVDKFGQIGDIIKGTAHSVPRDAFMAEVNKHSGKNILASLHSHPGKTSQHLSPGDIYASYNRAYFDENKIPISGSINEGIISAIDWREIDVNIASQIVQRYRDLMNSWQSTMPDVFTYNEQTKKYDANGDKIMADVELQKNISKKYNEILQQTLSEFGYADRYMKFDDAEKFASHILGEAVSQVSNIVIESGAKAAVESSKQISKEDIKKQQTALQEKFKTKDAETGKPKYSVTGASKIDQAFYNVGDKLTKESLTDKDLSKLTTAYDQLENAFKAEIMNHLDEETINFLNALRGQISTVLDANASKISAKEQQSKAIAEAKKYLSELKTEEGKRVQGASRAKTGIEQIYGVLDKGKASMSKKDLTALSQGYDRLQQTVNHAVYAKLDENTKTVINDAIQNAKTTLDKHGIISQSDDITKKQAQEIATTEAAITQEKQKQNKLATEAAQKEEKTAGATKKRAEAEKKITNEKTGGKTTTDGIVVPQGGNHGSSSIHTLAQEPTLQKILTILSSGIKVTSNGNGSSGTTVRKNNELTIEDAEATARSYIEKNYPNYTKLGDLKPTANGYSIDVFQPRLKEIAATQQLINKLEADGKKHTDDYVQAKSKLKDLELEREKITLRINNIDGQMQVTERRALQNLAVGTQAAAKELQLVDNMISRLHESGTISVSDTGDISSKNATVTNYLKSLRALQDDDGTSERRLSELTLATQGYRKEVEALLRASEQYNSGDKIGVLSGDFGDNYGAIKTAMQGMVAETSKYKTTFGELTPVIKNGQVVSYQLAYSLKIGKREVQEMTASLNPLTNELRVQKGAVKEVKTGWDAFWSGFKGKFRSITQYLFSMGSIHRLWSTLRQGVQYVRDIDSALTELRKVTNQTESEYREFLQTMSQTASVTGSTVKDLTSSSADWARLNI